MKKIFAAILAACGLACALALPGCASEPDLCDSVSEYRSELYSGTEGDYSVFATYSEREYPYLADGNIGDMTALFEVALTAADNTKTYELTFVSGGETYTAQLNFDSVRMAHTWSRTLPKPQETELVFTIRNADEPEGETVTVTAHALRESDTLDASSLLSAAYRAYPERFDALKDGNRFAGEIHIRLLSGEKGCLYYIGLIDRTGNTFAMLADAKTGEILATHEG